MSSQCCAAADGYQGEPNSTYALILQRMMEMCCLIFNQTHEFLYSQFDWLVSDLLGLDTSRILQYIKLIYWPTLVFLVLPIAMVILLYASALFLNIYKWRNRLQEAYHKDFWDGARQTLAIIWAAQASIWHGYEIEGLENIPDTGPALLVYYHGAIPLDVYYLVAKIYLHKRRLIHPIGDRCLFYIPGFQLLMRVFQVQPGTIESCTKLLQGGHIIAISPGGIREALFSHNYELMWNKRTGFAKVALASQAPVIPIFTKNSRQAINTLSCGKRLFRYLYERTKLPFSIFYGLFPVKLKTYIGTPIPICDGEFTAEQLSLKVHSKVEKLIQQHQRPSGSILMALLDRFRNS